jgi:hypothetical protein
MKIFLEMHLVLNALNEFITDFLEWLYKNL